VTVAGSDAVHPVVNRRARPTARKYRIRQT
jgi:hypothetical protein